MYYEIIDPKMKELEKIKIEKAKRISIKKNKPIGLFHLLEDSYEDYKISSKIITAFNKWDLENVFINGEEVNEEDFNKYKDEREEWFRLKTGEEICNIAERRSKSPLGQRRIINKLFRLQDESHLFPINGKFNVTERSIRRINQIERYNGTLNNLEYCYSLEGEMSNIVNDSSLW